MPTPGKLSAALWQRPGTTYVYSAALASWLTAIYSWTCRWWRERPSIFTPKGRCFSPQPTNTTLAKMNMIPRKISWFHWISLGETNTLAGKKHVHLHGVIECCGEDLIFVKRIIMLQIYDFLIIVQFVPNLSVWSTSSTNLWKVNLDILSTARNNVACTRHLQKALCKIYQIKISFNQDISCLLFRHPVQITRDGGWMMVCGLSPLFLFSFVRTFPIHIICLLDICIIWVFFINNLKVLLWSRL